jgi:enoyl-CoA hydratase
MSLVLYESADRVALIRINRPEKRNAMNVALVAELQAAWARFEAGDDRVAIVTGTDKFFSGGADLKDMPPDFWKAVPGLGAAVSKPVIAAVAGPVVGGACVIVQMCDLCVAAENAVFSYPEAAVGFTGGLMSALVARIPHKIAMEFLLLCTPLPAARAYEVGFVNAVVPAGKELETARAWALRIAGYAPLVVDTLKAFAAEVLPQGPAEAAALARRRLEAVNFGADAQEGRAAFEEKRKPRFKGR